jgi:hypothetical protein
MTRALDNPEAANRRAAGARAMVLERYERRLVFDRLANVLAAR